MRLIQAQEVQLRLNAD